MVKQIVVGEKEKFDFFTTFKTTKTLEDVEQLKQEEEKDVVYMLPVKDNDSSVLIATNNKVYIPYTHLQDDHLENGNASIYFDLENYPFFKKIKSVILKEENPKGVFRYRRMMRAKLKQSVVAEDLFVISSIFGKPKDIHVKQSPSSDAVHHIILSVDFGGGQLAHIEYTQSIREKIEVEWSGIKQIIEFNSDEVTPIQPENYTSLPLSYSVDSVLHTAHKADKDIMERLWEYNKMLDGGVNK